MATPTTTAGRKNPARITLTLQPDLYDFLEAEAAKRGLTFDEMVKLAVKEAIAHDPAADGPPWPYKRNAALTVRIPEALRVRFEALATAERRTGAAAEVSYLLEVMGGLHEYLDESTKIPGLLAELDGALARGEAEVPASRRPGA